MRTDFHQCYLEFSADTPQGQALRSQWGWTGPIAGVSRNATTQISLAGCLHLCGSGMDTYPWRDVSSTLTTWILPIVGTLLQAPFESNATRRTILAIMRWVGSPIASLSYILWNIAVSAKAALMVDMAVKYTDTPDRKTDFGSMRDSMYLLTVMNQYTIKPSAILREKEAEGLLRIVLFSKDLKMTDTDKTLRHMRRILAREVREMRRRGVVPVFVSTMWFLFAFALSIQAAFGDLGQNTTAHDLAMGCLLAWFPVLIMGSIVDRNPMASEAVRKKLNALVDHVRHALRDKYHRAVFIDSFRDQAEFTQLKTWVQDVADKGDHMYDFFEEFAGQARVRWHYGAAHPILSDIENCYIADRGRNWLANEREARANLVLGPVNDEGLVWFDIREFWQVSSAILIVAGSCGGAFVLSFFTPTVGLGCRSGGYTIFFSIALGLLIVEMVVWLVLSPYEVEAPWLTRTAARLHGNLTFNRLEDDVHSRWVLLKRKTTTLLEKVEGRFVRFVSRFALLVPWGDGLERRAWVEGKVDGLMSRLRNMSPQRRWEVFFFRPLEAFNTLWLICIVLAQTFGWYKTCACMTSTWAHSGGYLDFSKQDSSNSKWVLYYWVTGTVLTAVTLGIAMFYITVEWCQQSFLATEDYTAAMRGLRRTRKYKSGTYVFRYATRAMLWVTVVQLEKFAVYIGAMKRSPKTLLWTKTYTWDPIIPSPPISPNISSPEIHLTDHSTLSRRSSYRNHNTLTSPPMPHSLFPPTISRANRHRSSSDASSIHSPPLGLRTSDDSSRPLIPRRPSEPGGFVGGGGGGDDDAREIHRRGSETDNNGRGIEMRRSLDERLSFEHLLSPPGFSHTGYDEEGSQTHSHSQSQSHTWLSGLGLSTANMGASGTVHSRHGYTRAGSMSMSEEDMEMEMEMRRSLQPMVRDRRGSVILEEGGDEVHREEDRHEGKERERLSIGAGLDFGSDFGADVSDAIRYHDVDLHRDVERGGSARRR